MFFPSFFPVPAPMTDADLLHLRDTSSPITDEERLQAAYEIERLRSLNGQAREILAFSGGQPNGY